MKQQFLWVALGVFTVGCLMGTPVWADHHEATEQAAEAADETMPEAAGLIDINTADAAALQTLPGIGEIKAAAIIAHREANGPFTTVDDLQNVKGVGEKTLETLKEHITVGAVRENPAPAE